MNTNKLTNWRRWLTLLTAIGLVAAGGFYVAQRLPIVAQNAATTTQVATADASTQLATVAIQPAELAQTAVSAAGNLALVSERSVALAVDGVVDEIDVAVGGTVNAGDTLIKLKTTALDRELAQAELAVEAAKIALAELQTPATAAEVAQAEAALIEAKENLADVQAGADAAEIAAARSTLAAAQASYAELQAGPSDAELTQLSAALKKAEVTVQEAQRAYDKVAWQGSGSAEAADLQSATIDYEAAKAAYEEATMPASDSELQTAVGAIQSAQVQLDTLLNSPTAAEVATAQAQVAEAEANLADLQSGATANEVRSSEITLQQALIELEAAHRDLAAATVTAPVAGVVMTLNAEVGVRSAADTVVATLADPTQLELVINVAEADMPGVAVGQDAQIEIDALPGQTFAGVVAAVSPASDSSSSSVTYPVTIRLTDDNLAGVLPGMNAVATLSNQTPLAAGSWLVPTNALRQESGATTVQIVRGETTLSIPVTTGKVQGEWTTVQSSALQDGDAVVGSVTTDQDSNSFMPGGPPPDAGLGGIR